MKAGFPFGSPPPGPHPGSAIGVLDVAGLDLLRASVPLEVQRLVLALVGHLTDALRQDVRDAIRDGLAAGEPNAQVADRLPAVFGPRRAYTVAATESSRVMHSAEASYAQEAGAAGLEWMASADACEECLPLNGRRVTWGKPFAVLTSGNPAYRTVCHPPLHPRCMCSASPWWAEDERRVRR